MSDASRFRGQTDCYGISRPGADAADNSDQFFIADLKNTLHVHQSTLTEESSWLYGGVQTQLLAVADGIGRGRVGRMASKLAMEALSHYLLNAPAFHHDQPHEEDPLPKALSGAFLMCRQRMLEEVQLHPDLAGMGSTLTLACIVWPRLIVVHAGDSRCYLLRSMRLQQLTTDHTLAQRMIDEGSLNPSEASKSRWGNVLWNAVGVGSTVVCPQVTQEELRLGDALLLCTDGLNRQISDRRITEIMRRDDTARKTCLSLIHELEGATTADNATAVVARFRTADRQQQLAEAELRETPPVEEIVDGAAVGGENPADTLAGEIGGRLR